jgi:hypothetical protein
MAPSPSLAFDQMGNAGLTVQLIRFSFGSVRVLQLHRFLPRANCALPPERPVTGAARAASNWRRPSYRIDLNNTPIAKSAVPPFTILATHTRA